VYHPGLPAQLPVVAQATFRRVKRMLKHQMKSVAVACLLFCGVQANAADIGAGKAAAQAKCVECHEADDWEGEDAASLESLIRDIVAGKVKHKKKLELSNAEIANIAAYWGTGGKQKG
jgi:mono/diheme cytochrome c family protein